MRETLIMASRKTLQRIAWRVRLLRTARGWSKVVLSMKAAVDPLIVSAVEAAEPVNPLLLKRIARSLGVLVSDLCDDADWAVVKILHREGEGEGDSFGLVDYAEPRPGGKGH